MSEIRYLLTGGCGFIGSYVIEQLLKNTDNIIINVDKMGAGSSVNNVSKDERVTNYFVDICDERIFSIFEASRPDYIVHLAAESHVDRSIVDPIGFVESNVNGTVNIIEGMRRFAPKARMVHVSTDEVYGHLKIGEVPFTELTHLDPRSPYSASKASSDLLALSYRSTYGLDITVTRCCNNYGPRQDNEKLIPTIIRSIVLGKKVPMYGSGLNIREWIHAEDHAKALLYVLHHLPRQRVYNLYGTEEINNITIINTIVDEIVKQYPEYKRESNEYIESVKDRQGHDFRYAMSTVNDDVIPLHKQRNFFKQGIPEVVKYYVERYKSL
jgi:dTDP-glucose 4,6-dehydratase